MNKMILALYAVALLSSCSSQKKVTELEEKNKEIEGLLGETKNKLNTCLAEKGSYNSQVNFLQKSNSDLINNMGNLTTLSSKGAENLEKSLESLREKDLTIKNLRDALTRKDSVTLALVTSLKSVLGNLNDTDIEINVEKGVVFISISDKLLFKTGSYQVNDKAKAILGKVAKVVNNKPNFEFMVEGHTDDIPMKGSASVLQDNWDLSVKRATSVVRVLQNEFNIDPKRITAAGRSQYMPLVPNTSADNRAKNRRTRIVVLPKIDQFYDMIEKEIKEQSVGTKKVDDKSKNDQKINEKPKDAIQKEIKDQKSYQKIDEKSKNTIEKEIKNQKK